MGNNTTTAEVEVQDALRGLLDSLAASLDRLEAIPAARAERAEAAAAETVARILDPTRPAAPDLRPADALRQGLAVLPRNYVGRLIGSSRPDAVGVVSRAARTVAARYPGVDGAEVESRTVARVARRVARASGERAIRIVGSPGIAYREAEGAARRAAGKLGRGGHMPYAADAERQEATPAFAYWLALDEVGHPTDLDDPAPGHYDGPTSVGLPGWQYGRPALADRIGVEAAAVLTAALECVGLIACRRTDCPRRVAGDPRPHLRAEVAWQAVADRLGWSGGRADRRAARAAQRAALAALAADERPWHTRIKVEAPTASDGRPVLYGPVYGPRRPCTLSPEAEADRAEAWRVLDGWHAQTSVPGGSRGWQTRAEAAAAVEAAEAAEALAPAEALAASLDRLDRRAEAFESRPERPARAVEAVEAIPWWPLVGGPAERAAHVLIGRSEVEAAAREATAARVAAWRAVEAEAAREAREAFASPAMVAGWSAWQDRAEAAWRIRAAREAARARAAEVLAARAEAWQATRARAAAPDFGRPARKRTSRG